MVSWIVTLGVGIAGMGVLLVRAERRGERAGEAPFFTDFYVRLFLPVARNWRDEVRPMLAELTLRGAEEFAHLLARYARLAERSLIRYGNMIRGKRMIQNNGGSAYWEEIQRSKNGEGTVNSRYNRKWR